ncbi:PQQ-dependent sugar dehydrogenase [Fodinibius halophilus]|uniref:Sorbosone dehydrogenase n=1 Tax=Fodinibius halophilus TaxID=1736908 RepID=A0A6M1T3V5_9BACT|nr:PQQ-dependent sugar dehydrogenase [Fodinibius halophilus]NGP87905.1 sorbosone dehydrogenase [Fodinibius halophilus]
MIRSVNYLLLLITVVSLGACSSQTGSEINFSDNNGDISLPDGFKATVVADSIGQARHITVNNNGNIYVALREPHNGNGVVALADEDNDGQADITKYFGNYSGTGIQVYNGYLYFGSNTEIVRYKLGADKLVPSGNAEVVVEGFPQQRQHAAKSITFDQDGHLYVNIGGPSNACQEEMRTPGSPGMAPCPQLESHGGIWQFDANQTGQSLQEDGKRYTTGIRNAVALDWNTHTDRLYVVQHGRDQLHTLWPDYFTAEQNAALPAEEFFEVQEGDNFGWPYTYYDQQKEEKMLAPEYGGDGQTVAEEGKYEDPILAFPGHWAPNDVLFYGGAQFPDKYKNGAFIAFHGSWNRAPEPQQGYKVVFAPFDNTEPTGDYWEFADGFAGKDSLQSPGNAEYRPMGLATYNDGSLLITDSRKGKIWRVVYTGN